MCYNRGSIPKRFVKEDEMSTNVFDNNNTANNNTVKKVVGGVGDVGFKLTKKVDEFVSRATPKCTAVTLNIPWIVVIIAILLAYKAGVFDSTPGIRHLVLAMVNLIDWLCEQACRILSTLLQGPLVWLGDILFPPVG